MKKQLFVLIAVIIFNQICSAGQLRTYSRTGKVIDYRGEPVPGAEVVYYHYDSNFANITPLASKLCDICYTSSDGTFSFDVNKERCVSLIVVCKSGYALGWAGLNLQSELSPTIRLSKPSILKGRVVDEKGNPVANADVRVYLRSGMMSKLEDITFDLPDHENWYSRKTDSEGQFLFDNVPESSYAIFQVKAPGKASICIERDDKSYTEYFAAGRDDIRIVLPSEARIRGKVIDESTGLAIPGIQIKAEYCNKDSFLYPEKVVQTDSNGVFEFTQLESYKYQLSIKDDKEGYGYITVDVKSGQTNDNVKIIYKKGLPFSVKVFNPDDEKGIQNASVTISQRDEESGHDIFSQIMTTDTNGIAKFMIPPGESNIEVTKLDYGATLVDQYDLKINTDLENKIEVSLPHSSYYYSGQAIDEQGSPLEGTEIIQEQFGPRMVTNTDGCFDSSNEHVFITRLPSKIKIFARHESTGLATFTQLNDPNRTGHLSGKVILKPAYTITGTVLDPNGQAIPAAYVQLVEGQSCTIIAEVATDSNGQYTIRSVPYSQDDLNYFVVGCAHGYNYEVGGQIPFADDVTIPIVMQPIELLPADKAISGIVVDANEQPVSGTKIWINGPDLLSNYHRPPYIRLLSDKQGRFYFKGVSEEPLDIIADPLTEQQKYGKIFARGGDTDIKIVLGQTLYYSRSLIGKKLPDIKKFGIDSFEDNKKVLICFFDIEQRPSRNCILELNKKVQELSEKSIEIVIIQTANIEQSELNEWVKENELKLPVILFQGEWDKVRTEWGIEALPWIICTDKEHNVIAEGLSMDELELKIGGKQ